MAESWHERCTDEDARAVREAYLLRTTISPEELLQRLTPYNRRKVDLLAQHVRQLACEGEEIRVLDVGCGTGELLTVPLRHLLCDLPNVEIAGIDIDAASIARAQETVACHCPDGLRFEVRQIDEVAERFDCVICSEVLEHLEDPGGFLCSLAACVSAQGWLLLSTPNGFGYGEVERRVVYACLSVAQRLPLWGRRVARVMYRGLRRVLKPLVLPRAPKDKSERAHVMMGTLNFANDVHIRYFSMRSLVKLIDSAGMDVKDVQGLKLFGGIVGTIVERQLRLDRLRSIVPKSLVGHWYIACRASERTSV